MYSTGYYRLLIFSGFICLMVNLIAHRGYCGQDKRVSGEEEERKVADAITRYEAILMRKSGTNDSRHASIRFQLAQLYTRQEKIDFDKKWSLYEKLLKQYQDGRMQTPPEEPILQYARSIHHYNEILKEHPEYQEIDKVLYNLGLLYMETDQFDTAADILGRLIQEHSICSLTGYGRLALSQIFIHQELYENVIEVLEPIALNDLVNSNPAIIHRLGWANLHLGEYDKAVVWFSELLSKGTDRQEWEIFCTESINCIAFCLAEENGLEGLRTLLSGEKLQDTAPDLYIGLAEILYERDRDKEAIEVSNEFTIKWPIHPEIPDVKLQIAEYYLGMQKKQEAVRQLKELSVEIGPNSIWAKANITNPELIAGASIKREKALLRAIHLQWGIGESSGSNRDYVTILRDCRNFLNEYPSSEFTDEVEHFAAASLFELKRYKEAAEFYSNVAGSTESTEKREDSMYGALRSWYSLDMESSDNGNVAKQLALAAKEFIENYPESPNAIKGTLKAGNHLFEREFYTDAMLCFSALETEHLTIDQKSDVAAKIGRCAMRLEDYSKAEDWFLRLSNTTGNPDERKKAIEAAALAAFSDAKRLRDEHKFITAAESFKTIADKYYNITRIAISSIAASSRCFADADDLENAITIARKLIELYPESEEACTAFFMIAKYLKEIGNIGEAAVAYRKAARECPRSTDAPGALLHAGQIIKDAAGFQEAITYYDELLEKYPDSREAVMASGSLADYFYERSAWENAYTNYMKEEAFILNKLSANSKENGEKSINLERLIQSEVRVGICLEHMDKKREAMEWFDKAQKTRATYSSVASDHADYSVATGFHHKANILYNNLVSLINESPSSEMPIVEKVAESCAKAVKAFEKAASFGFWQISFDADLSIAKALNATGEWIIRSCQDKDYKLDRKKSLCQDGIKYVVQSAGIMLALKNSLNESEADSTDLPLLIDREMDRVQAVGNIPELLANQSLARERDGLSELDRASYEILDIMEAEMFLSVGSYYQSEIISIAEAQNPQGILSAVRKKYFELEVRRGELLESIGELILSSPPPENLNADEIEQYNMLLNEKAAGFRAKAIKVYQYALKEVHSIETSQEKIQELRSRIEKLHDEKLEP